MGVALEGEGGGSVPGEGLEMPYGLPSWLRPLCRRSWNLTRGVLFAHLIG